MGTAAIKLPISWYCADPCCCQHFPQQRFDCILFGFMTAEQDNYMRLLGLEVVRLEPGQAVLTALVKAEHLNIHGTCHGGFIYSLADAAFALASNAHGVTAVALTTHMEYFKAVKEGDRLEAVASEENLGRRTGTYRIEVRRGGQVVALFGGTVFRVGAEN